jgi:catechol 2,3-dioxygenase-like lactoylglutathione lyase family enzyme
MAKVVGIDHLVIRVGDFDASRRFYDLLLTFLGFVREWEFDRTVGWNNGVTMFWIAEADAEGRAKRYRIGDIGYHHYAFELGAREEVDELYEFLRREHATVIDPPAAYPSYGDGYYAVFFLDPDGLKLECMYFLEKVKRAGLPPRGL